MEEDRFVRSVCDYTYWAASNSGTARATIAHGTPSALTPLEVHQMKGLIIAASVILSSTAVFADSAQKTLGEAAAVFSEIMATPDKGIPQEFLEKAQCVMVVPGLKKAAFVV